MKKKVILAAVAIIFACCMLLGFSGCDFVTYNKTESGEALSYKKDLGQMREEYVSRLRGLVSEDDFYEDELNEYRLQLIECVNRINECDDVEELPKLYESCEDTILSIKTIEDYEIEEEVAPFETYRSDKVKEIKAYVVLEDYRLEECAEVMALIEEFEGKIYGVTDCDYTAVDNFVRDFKIKVYGIPTAAELYSDELQQLKEQLITALKRNYKLSNYRDTEGAHIHELLELFESAIDTLVKKEDVLSQYILTKNNLDAVKTAAVLAEEERINLIEDLYGRMKRDIANNIGEAEQKDYYNRAEEVYAAMRDRLSPEGVREVYRAFAVEISPEAIAEELAEYNNTVKYREAQQREVQAIKDKYADIFNDDLTLDDAKDLFNKAKQEIDAVKTNDDLWEDGVNEFRANLKSLYGDEILEEPRSLTEAKDYYELADIIDYYAFYQKSGTEFVCDTFRVKLNFDHNDAWTELVNVYWYCELIRTAVGITSYFEDNSDYLVFQLIPYNFASVSNDCPALNRLESAVEFDSDKSQMTVRSDDFDNFAYYEYGRTIKVWNSQQLWYALEHEYAPICEADSPAERVMFRAKEILRKIIMEGMSDEEKIFQIYTWFGKNCQYDWKYDSFSNSSDPVKLPDENISRLTSMHVEGALFEHLGVCYSYAKANLLLLRLEGIETYYGFGRSVISEISYKGAGGAGHGYNYIHLNNNWYIGDALRSFYQSKNYGEGISYLFLMLPAKGIYKNFTERYSKVNSDIWPLIENESKDNRDIYKKLIVNGNNIFIDDTSDDKISLFDNIQGESFSIICAPDSLQKVQEHLIELELYDVYSIRYIDSYIELFCKRI